MLLYHSSCLFWAFLMHPALTNTPARRRVEGGNALVMHAHSTRATAAPAASGVSAACAATPCRRRVQPPAALQTAAVAAPLVLAHAVGEAAAGPAAGVQECAAATVAAAAAALPGVLQPLLTFLLPSVVALAAPAGIKQLITALVRWADEAMVCRVLHPQALCVDRSCPCWTLTACATLCSRGLVGVLAAVANLQQPRRCASCLGTGFLLCSACQGRGKQVGLQMHVSRC
jgi:hypothetical protein